MKTWLVTMAGWLPEDVLVRGCTEFRTSDEDAERSFLLKGETPEAAVRGSLQRGIAMEPWGFGGDAPEGGAMFALRVGGFGEPECVTVAPGDVTHQH